MFFLNNFMIFTCCTLQYLLFIMQYILEPKTTYVVVLEGWEENNNARFVDFSGDNQTNGTNLDLEENKN